MMRRKKRRRGKRRRRRSWEDLKQPGESLKSAVGVKGGVRGEPGHTGETTSSLAWMNHRMHVGRREEAGELDRSHRGSILKALYFKSIREP